MLRILFLLFLFFLLPVVNAGFSIAQSKELLDREFERIDASLSILQRKYEKLQTDFLAAEDNLAAFKRVEVQVVGEVQSVDYLNRFLMARSDSHENFTFVIPRGVDPYLFVKGRTYDFGTCTPVDPNQSVSVYEVVVRTRFERVWLARRDELVEDLQEAKAKLEKLKERRAVTGIYKLKDGEEVVGAPVLDGAKIVFTSFGKKTGVEVNGTDLSTSYPPNARLIAAWEKRKNELAISLKLEKMERLGLEMSDFETFRLANGREFEGNVQGFGDGYITLLDLATERVADVRLPLLDDTHENTADLLQRYQTNRRFQRSADK